MLAQLALLAAPQKLTRRNRARGTHWAQSCKVAHWKREGSSWSLVLLKWLLLCCRCGFTDGADGFDAVAILLWVAV